MRNITKGREPGSLTLHRKQKGNYDDMNKDELRKALVAEQRGVCCYCMARIDVTNKAMKIEHWQCQKNHPGKTLNYGNLLAACPGGEGLPDKLTHCDTKKKDKELKYNPANPAHKVEARVSYELDGTIRSKDPTFERELNDVLNLNLEVLKSNRRGELKNVIDWWKKRKDHLKQRPSKAEVAQKIEKLIGGNRELNSPFIQVAVFWLRKKL